MVNNTKRHLNEIMTKYVQLFLPEGDNNIDSGNIKSSKYTMFKVPTWGKTKLTSIHIKQCIIALYFINNLSTLVLNISIRNTKEYFTIHCKFTDLFRLDLFSLDSRLAHLLQIINNERFCIVTYILMYLSTSQIKAYTLTHCMHLPACL